MVSDTIIINEDDLYNLVREAVRDELQKIEDVSDEEQLELETLYGNKPGNKSINYDECIEL